MLLLWRREHPVMKQEHTVMKQEYMMTPSFITHNYTRKQANSGSEFIEGHYVVKQVYQPLKKTK